MSHLYWLVCWLLENLHKGRQTRMGLNYSNLECHSSIGNCWQTDWVDYFSVSSCC